MKRVVAFLLCIAMLLTGCSPAVSTVSSTSASYDASSKTELAESVSNAAKAEKSSLPQFSGLDDTDLTAYVEDLIYQDTITSLNSDAYVVEEVSAVYISKEYIEELAYNSQSNVYFGYTIDELNEIFQGKRYVFTLGDDGQTAVRELETIENTDTETVIKNVAVGSGVILICVTVSAVSAGVGAPAAVTAIFAASADTATKFAVSSAMFGGISAAIVSGYQTGDWRESLQSFALSGSEGFKWGAIIGGISGGAKGALVLKAGTKGGLTMSEVATIQKESKLPIKAISKFRSMTDYNSYLDIISEGTLSSEDLASILCDSNITMDVIKNFRSLKEYDVYKNAQLYEAVINGKSQLVRSIDLDYVSDLAGKQVTNLERMEAGYAPIDPLTGKAYELHHIGQSVESPLAILTTAEHRQGDNYSILHDTNITDGKGVHSLLSESVWAKQKQEFWKAFYQYTISGS